MTNRIFDSARAANGNAIFDAILAVPAAPIVNTPIDGSGDWRSARAFADRFDRLDRAPKPTKAAKKLRRKQIEVEVLELLPDEPEARAMAPLIAQAVYRKEAAAIARWTPPVALMPVTPMSDTAAGRAQAAQFDAAETIRQMVAQWMQNEALEREIDAESDEENEIEMLLLG